MGPLIVDDEVFLPSIVDDDFMLEFECPLCGAIQRLPMSGKSLTHEGVLYHSAYLPYPFYVVDDGHYQSTMLVLSCGHATELEDPDIPSDPELMGWK